ncbi:MAG: NAD-dependent epimerase/dehydratase family protein [Nakamurella sp.]
MAPARRRIDDLVSSRFEPPCPVCGRALAPTSVDESARLDPRNVYAATKVHQEQLGAAFADASGSDVVSLRYHNVYGPRMPRDTPYAPVASIFRSACEAGKAPKVFEDGRQRRDFIHVSDVARANLLALSAPAPVGGAYNIATGQVTTVLDMARAICAGFTGSSAPPIVTGEFRLGDVRHVTASPQLARTTLGFATLIGPADGLRDFATAPLRGSTRRASSGSRGAGRTAG